VLEIIRIRRNFLQIVQADEFPSFTEAWCGGRVPKWANHVLAFQTVSEYQLIVGVFVSACTTCIASGDGTKKQRRQYR
jgi:hypothetical protein